MKISGKPLADSILNALKLEIQEDQLKATLAIILASDNPSSRLYVNNKLARAGEIGIEARLYQFNEDQKDQVLPLILKLNKTASGIIIQFPVYQSWDFPALVRAVDAKKDVDGFRLGSPFIPATAAAVWEMLSEFARIEGFDRAEDFLKGKNITVLGRGKTAGGPIRELLLSKRFPSNLIHSQTENPNGIIQSSDVIISATGRHHIINASNIKKGAYIIGVGVSKDENNKTIGDIDESGIAEKAKLYCPTIGGIGPLTIACLLRNVVKSAKR